MNGTDEQIRLHLWLSYGTEHFTRCRSRVLARYADLNEAFALAARGGAAAFDFLPARAAARLTEAATEGFLDGYRERLERTGIRVAFPFQPEYPALLKEIHDPPGALYYRGRLLGEPPLPIAVVGSRAATDYGKDVARLFSHAFSTAGATVISGMASGVDASAARGALDCVGADYPTVAVLGTGVDLVYPAANRRLYEEIMERGAVISEFLPGTEARREHFPIRNRIMSGMAKGVLVVEAGERSGTAITAGYALEEGREVFAVPGRITDPQSLGVNRMIRQGEAKPVFCPEDVLCEFGVTGRGEPSALGRAPDLSDLSREEKTVAAALLSGEKSFDELCECLPYPPGLLNSYLTALEFSGIMKQLPGRIYALRRS